MAAIQAFEKIYLMWQTLLTLSTLQNKTLYVISNLKGISPESFNSTATILKYLMIPFAIYSAVHDHLSRQQGFSANSIFRFPYSRFFDKTENLMS